jgi:hypothetical protein
MAQLQMEFRGTGKVGYTPSGPPPQSVAARKSWFSKGSTKEVSIFEPFEESLPLQSGFYGYVIDEEGRFHLMRGNTRSHAAMVRGAPACAAGWLRVGREGRTIHVRCCSTDYSFKFHSSQSYAYIIESFKNHPAFALSANAVFEFHTGFLKKVYRSASGTPIDNPYERLKLLDEEGLGESASAIYSPDQAIQFQTYAPIRPPRLHAMHLDQIATEIDGTDDEGFHFGDPAPRLDLNQTTFRPGKNNFVIDSDGRLIVGISGHQLLSGGQRVGGAGHIHFDSQGTVVRLDTNFSGHYRPPLSADYVRYVYQVVATHPLIMLADDCRFFGRWFDEETVRTQVLEFSRDEIASDDPRLDQWIESCF